MDGGVLEAQLEYWRAKMAGAPALLELPTDHSRPQVQTFRGAGVPITLPRELADALRGVARREGATLFMVLLAAWQVLLARYSGQPDVVVGTTLAGRTRREVEPLIGMFFNTLPLRTDLSGDPGFRDLLGRVRETTLEAYANQDLPFEKLVEALAPERTLSRTPIIQVLFELQNNARSDLALAGVKSRGVGGAVAQAKFDLTLSLTETADGVAGVLQYAADLFEPESIRRMAAQFSVLLAGIAEDASRPVSALPVISAEERHEVLSEWNDTDRPFPSATLHGLFEDQVGRTPGALALVQGRRRLSYAELDIMAEQVAALLRRHGAGPEVRVALLLERTPELIAALLGVLKAGAAYLPLDPTHPAERLAYMVGDAGARIILTHAPLRAAAEELAGAAGSQVVGVEERTQLDTLDGSRPDVGPEHLAYVYYTSGSTGRPKGVAMHHRGICNYVQWAVPAYGADQKGGAPVFTSIAVDLTLANLLPLFAGRPVELMPEGPGLGALADRLREDRPFSFIKITPTHLALLNAFLTPEEARRAAGTLVIGADNLLAEPTRFWQDEAPEVRLLNEYGPTETVVGCALYALPPGRHRTGRVPIGRAIENLRMYVLDAHMQPAPVGISGELYIGGVGVARGYLGRPGLTAEKFVPDPYAKEPGARLYRTGDRARWRIGGQMEFLGRLDHQAKVRGYRVEPGEVEAVLREHEGVRAAAVVVREDARGDAGLVAYVVPAHAVEIEELRAHLRRRVPEYMVPGAIVLMDELPLGTTGKLDPGKLPAPEPSRADRRAMHAAPADELEERLAEIWAAVLGVERVGVEDDFFELGGHSLQAARLTAAIRKHLGREVPLSALLEGGTVRALAAGMRGQEADARPQVLVELRPGGGAAALFLLHGAGGGLLAYTALLRRLPPGRPVYGLQDPLQAQGKYSDLTVEEFARIYLDEVRAVQPRGPYHLVGLSFGGAIAFEMARRLRAAGEEVALLGLLDTWAPAFSDYYTNEEETSRKALIGLARERARAAGMEFPLHAADLAGLEAWVQVERVLGRLKEMGVLPRTSPAEPVLQALGAMWARTRVQRAYRPEAYPGRITLFTSGEVDPEFRESWPEMVDAALADPARGWARLSTEPVEVHAMPGSHTTMVREPHVARLAERLAECLAGAGDGRENGGSGPSAQARPDDPAEVRHTGNHSERHA
jgi:amino acid adenylation domain-containing protein